MVSMPDISNNESDPRVPHDRSDDTQQGEFYAHFTAGTCKQHGYTTIRCLHKQQDDGTTTVELSCVMCSTIRAKEGKLG